MPKYNLALYWGPRKETAEECAKRLKVFISEIAEYDDRFSEWGEKGFSRADALKGKIDIDDLSLLTRIVEKGTQRRDSDGRRIEALGFTFGLWNMKEGPESTTLGISCGISEIIPGIIGNSLVIGFSEELINRLKLDLVVRVLAASAKAWRPSWGGVFSLNSMVEQKFDLRNPLLDWLLYVDCHFGKVGHVDLPSRVVDVDQVGMILVVQDDPMQGSDESRIKLVRAARTALSIY